MKQNSFKLSAQRGFSLVELLVVIAVIAIIAAIAIPNIAGITGAANTAKAQRNAQNLASTYNAAIAAGYTVSTTTVDAAIAAITNGIEITIGNTTNNFKVDGLTQAEADLAEAYLSIGTNAGPAKTLVYSN
jgi:type IV pilus assembly protein PilA